MMMQQSCLIYFLVSSVAIQCGLCTYDCMKHCACKVKNGVLTADCRGLNFTEVPPPEPNYNVNVLQLQYNQITTLRMGDFLLFPDLIELYLQGNRINVIEERTFEGLRSLKKLDLSSNAIHSLPDVEIQMSSNRITWLSLAMNGLKQLPPALKNMSRLQYLDVSDNQFIVDVGSEPFPSSLVKLNMKHTGVKFFPKSAFESLTVLTTLILSDNMASSSLKFEDGVFDNLTSLEYIDLSRSFCKKMSGMSFRRLKNLKTLLMNNCWLSKPPILARRTVSDIVTPGIAGGYVDYNPGNATTSLPNYITVTTSGLTTRFSTVDPGEEIWYNPELLILDLSNNRRMSIGGTRFPPSVRKLGLASTRLLKVNLELFNGTIWMQKLDLSSARIQTIAEKAFQNFRNITKIDISGNPLEIAPALPSTLQSLELNGTRITNITNELLGNLVEVVKADFSNGEFSWIEEYAFQNMVSMETLDLSENKIDFLEPHTLTIGTVSSGKKREVQSGNRLSVLNLASNILRNIEPGAFSTLDQLLTLDLQGNFLSVIEPGMFSGLQRVEKLSLNGNTLVDIAPNALDSLTGIKELHLEDNELEIIFSGMFENMVLLKELYLQRNELALIHEILLPSLTVLDISNNNLTTFPKLGGQMLKEIKASHNPVEEFTPGALQKAVKLEIFRLTDTHISNMNYSELQWSLSLKSLDLTNNYISNFVDLSLPALERLSLNDNDLHGIGVNLVSVIPMISSLDIGYNKMTNLNPQVFDGATKLTRLNLVSNTFSCDCDLYPLVTWLKNHDAIVEELDAYVCVLPLESFGESILETVGQLTCSRKSTVVYGLIAVAIIVLAVVLLVLILLVRHRAKQQRGRDRIVSENGEPMLNERIEVKDKSTVTCCCFSPKRETECRRSRDRAESDDTKDLVVSSEVNSPSQKEAPTSL